MDKLEVGESVSIKKADGFWEGLVVNLDKNQVTLKLDSGYNVGIILDKGTTVEKLGKKKTKKQGPVKFKLSMDKSKPTVSIISSGGTISSSVDYSTGGISAHYSAEQLVSSVPEISNFANIRSRKVLEEMSENLIPKHWIRIATEVFKELKDSKGVIVTHGTDTLPYTSSMLSFMLRNLNKPVVITFAQKSSDRGSSDAAINLICSTITATKDIAEVVVVGHGTINDDYCLINRGNKVRKMHSSQRNSFRPINCYPIGKVWPKGKIEFISQYKKSSNSREDFYLDTKIEENVGIIKFYPGMDPNIIDYHIDKKFKGLIIEGTGLGHVNVGEKSLLPQIKRAIDEKIFVGMTTQTIYGRVNPYVYSNLRKLSEIGVVYLQDLLTETAYTKLMWVLGHTKNESEAKEMMLKNISGEFNERLQPDQFLN